MLVQLVVVLAMCLVSTQAFFVWPSQLTLSRTATTARSFTVMSTAVKKTQKAGKRSLETIKERYSGREDIFGMTGTVEEELASYQVFAEAEIEEIDPPKVGQTITGTVIEMDDNGALLEIGGKMSGYLPLKEASLIPIKHVNTILEVGQQVTAEVIGTLKGMPVMSFRSAQLVTAWEQVLSIRATDASFDAKVLEVNRGGAVCSALGLKAFLPGSHYLGVPDESLIGTTLKVRS